MEACADPLGPWGLRWRLRETSRWRLSEERRGGNAAISSPSLATSQWPVLAREEALPNAVPIWSARMLFYSDKGGGGDRAASRRSWAREMEAEHVLMCHETHGEAEDISSLERWHRPPHRLVLRLRGRGRDEDVNRQGIGGEV